MPIKHQPDLMYLRQVPVNRIHIFTLIQLFCLGVLWLIKSTDAALIFPVMVCPVLSCFVVACYIVFRSLIARVSLSFCAGGQWGFSAGYF